jgi:hypothetical protein
MTDANRTFYPIFLGLASHEDAFIMNALLRMIKQRLTLVNSVLADAAPAITSAANTNGIERMSCWFHCAHALKKRVIKKESLYKDEMFSNLRILQLALTYDEFVTG